MKKLTTTLDQALDAIERLNRELPQHPKLMDSLGYAHAFYVSEAASGDPLFGFSKFVGYDGLTPESYIANYRRLDGRNTEHALSKWFEEVRYGSPAYNALFDELNKWMAQFGKKPRGGKNQKARIMIVKPELKEAQSTDKDDRRLLDLMMAVSDFLPASQRHELRASL